MVKYYACHVYLPERKKLPAITAVASTPEDALASALKGLVKLPLARRRLMKMKIETIERERGQGAYSKPPINHMANLTRVSTLC